MAQIKIENVVATIKFLEDKYDKLIQDSYVIQGQIQAMKDVLKALNQDEEQTINDENLENLEEVNEMACKRGGAKKAAPKKKTAPKKGAKRGCKKC